MRYGGAAVPLLCQKGLIARKFNLSANGGKTIPRKPLAQLARRFPCPTQNRPIGRRMSVSVTMQSCLKAPAFIIVPS
jgi:hypothetical protein